MLFRSRKSQCYLNLKLVTRLRRMRSAAFTPLQRAQQRFPSPSPPKKGGEGRGEEAVLRHFPLSPTLSPLVPHGERGKSALSVLHDEHYWFQPAIQKVGNPRYDNDALTPLVMVYRFCRAGKPVCHPRKSAALAWRRFDLPGRSTDRDRARSGQPVCRVPASRVCRRNPGHARC